MAAYTTRSQNILIQDKLLSYTTEIVNVIYPNITHVSFHISRYTRIIKTTGK